MEIGDYVVLGGPRALKVIRAHALSVYPQECCGALIGRPYLSPERGSGAHGVEILDAVPIPNCARQSKECSYELDARAYGALEQRLHATAGTEGGSAFPGVVGFFHSHPDGPAVPSTTDLEMARGLFEFARTHYVYAIQACCPDGTVGVLRFWRMDDDAGGFIEMEIRPRISVSIS